MPDRRVRAAAKTKLDQYIETDEKTVLGYYRTDNQKRRGGDLHIERYFRVLSNALIQVADINKLSVRTQLSFGGRSVRIALSNKEEWEKMIKKINDNLLDYLKISS